MTIQIIVPPAPDGPRLLTYAELKRKDSGTIAKVSGSDNEHHRFVVSTGNIIGFHPTGSVFDTEGKGWEKNTYIVLPNASLNITFSE